jgi:hypothetical protein
MKILVMPKVAAKQSSGRGQPARLDEAKLLEDLANMRDDGTRQFRKRWERFYAAYSNESLMQHRDELQLVWQTVSPVFLTEANLTDATLGNVTSGMTKLQKHIFESWLENNAGRSLEEMVLEGWLNFDSRPYQHVQWNPKGKGVRTDARSLPSVLAFACLTHGDHLRVCQNEKCSARYFIGERKDQKYCSTNCAAPAQREAKRKWWGDNRGKTRKEGR